MHKDKIDEHILEFLRKDSRESFVEIGKKLKLSESAIRHIVKNMIMISCVISIYFLNVVRYWSVDFAIALISDFVCISEYAPNLPGKKKIPSFAIIWKW